MKKILVWIFRESVVWVRYIAPVILFILILDIEIPVLLKVVTLICIFGWWHDSCKIDFISGWQKEQEKEVTETKRELIKAYGVLKRIEKSKKQFGGKNGACKDKRPRIEHKN